MVEDGRIGLKDRGRERERERREREREQKDEGGWEAMVESLPESFTLSVPQTVSPSHYIGFTTSYSRTFAPLCRHTLTDTLSRAIRRSIIPNISILRHNGFVKLRPHIVVSSRLGGGQLSTCGRLEVHTQG